jgi:imidazolonepropionase-like amidohydrolase
MPEETVTRIRGGWIVAFDGTHHRIIRDGVVIVRGGTVTFVGKDWDGDADQEIDASSDLVMPGLVNVHSHVGAHAGDRMVSTAVAVTCSVQASSTTARARASTARPSTITNAPKPASGSASLPF